MKPVPGVADGVARGAPPPVEDILDFWQQKRDLTLAIARPYRQCAQLVEQFCNGNQFDAWNREEKRIDNDAWFRGEDVPYLSINLMQGKMTTWSALLNKDRRSVTAVPASPDDSEAIYTAEITNRFIDYFIQEERTAEKVHSAVQYAFQGGTAGLKVWYDPSKDRVRWERLTIHDYLIDPVEDYRQAKWVAFENHYDEDYIADLWEQTSRKTTMPTPRKYRNAAGEEVEGIPGAELWVKPCRRFKAGLYALIVEGEVLERKPYPIMLSTDGPTGEEREAVLPLALMKVRSNRSSAYGITPLKDIVDSQRTINETQARMVKMMRLVTNPHLVGPKDIVDQLNLDETNVLGYEKRGDEPAPTIEWTKPGDISANLFKVRDDSIAFMDAIIGLNEVTSGGGGTSMSGRAIEALYEIDSQKNSDALKSLDDMVSDAWHLTMGLVQINYTKQRQAKIANVNLDDVFMFSGSDIQGRNIRFEASSEIERRQDAQEAKAVEKAAAGVATAAEVDEARRTPANALAKKMASDAIKAFIAGDEVDINVRDHSMPALREAIDREKSRALATGQREVFKDLVELEMLIRDQIETEMPADDATGAPAAGEQAPPTDTISQPLVQG
jgi:hypothetical protein